MRHSYRPAFLATLLAVALPVVARAHPGHDDHDFAWDFSHLTAHPFATLACAAIIGVAVAITWPVSRALRDPALARK